MSLGINPTGGEPAPPPVGAPDAPVLMNTVSDGNVSVVVTFTKPNDHGSPITGYTAWLRSDTNTIKQPLTTSPSGSNLQATVGPMLLGVDYNLTVYATNAKGDGAESLSTVVSAYDESLPRDFQLLLATPLKDGAAIKFQKPWSPDPSLSFDCWAESDGPDPDVFEDLVVTQVDANTMTSNVTGISSAEDWYIYVRASNKFGRGNWSNDLPVTPTALKGPLGGVVKNLVTETGTNIITETAAEIVTS